MSDDDDEEVAVARIDGYEADALATDDEELEEDEDTLCTNLKCCISIHAVDKSEEGRRRRRRKTPLDFFTRSATKTIFFFERKNNFFLLVRAHAKKALRCFSMQRLAFALVMSASILLVVVLALRCIIFRQFFFFMPRVSRDNEV